MIIGLFGKKYDVTMASLTGRRSENQDSAGWAAVGGGFRAEATEGVAVPTECRQGRDRFIAIVCDGMGGLSDGAYAGRYVVSGILEWFCSLDAVDADTISEKIISEISKIEKNLMTVRPGSGTTISLAMAFDGKWISAHLGDSRCYGFGKTDYRTMDHSPVEDMFRKGLIEEEDENGHPMKNVVSAYVGGGFAEKTEIENIPEWDTLCLCTDGAHGSVGPREFRRIAASGDAAETAAEKFYAEGSRDNITVVKISAV